MPKSPAHSLIWSAESNAYKLHTPGLLPQLFAPGDETQWFAWLATHASFSFRGDAILYLDEAGSIEAAFSVRKVERRTCTAIPAVREPNGKVCA